MLSFRNHRLSIIGGCVACLALFSPGEADAATAVKAASLGVHAAQLPEALAAHLGIEAGALIVEVLPGSPAEKAGIKRHDVIVSAAGKAVRNPDDLRDAVGKGKPGGKLELEIRRGPETMKISAELGEPLAPDEPTGKKPGFLGVKYSAVPEVLRAHLEIESGVGVVIDDVLEDSAAAKAGLQKYDVIISVGGDKLKEIDAPGAIFPPEIKDIPDLPPALQRRATNFPELVAKRAEGDEIELEIIHKGKRQKIRATLGSRPSDPIPPTPRVDPFWRGKEVKPRSFYRGRFFWKGPDGEEHKIEIPMFELGPDKDPRFWPFRDKNIEEFLDEKLPKDLRGRVRRLLDKYKPGLKLELDFGAPDQGLPDVFSTTREYKKRVSAIKRIEGDEEITVRDENGRRTVTVKKKGKTIAENLPFAEIDALPEEIRKKVQAIAGELPEPQDEEEAPQPEKKTIEIERLGGIRV